MVVLLATALAQAASFTAAPTVDVVGAGTVGVRPGLRLGFEPLPAAAFEVLGDSDFSGAWDAGPGLTGRWFFTDWQGEGLYLQGRFVAGFSGLDDTVGSWTGVFGGFGARPVSWLDIAAIAGPEWAPAAGGPRWRSGLSVGVVLDPAKLRTPVGSGTQRHRPRKVQ